MATKSSTKAQSTGHPSKGGNGQGTSKLALSPDAQDAIRRATKRSGKPKGMANLVNSPTVGETKAGRLAAWERIRRQRGISDERTAIAILASFHPQVSSLTRTAGRAAQKFFEYYSKSPVGDPAKPCPRKWAESLVWATMAQEDLARPKAITLGLVRAKEAINESIRLSAMAS